MQNLFQRVLVGAVGIPAFYLIIRLGSWPLLLLAAAQAALGSREFFTLAGSRGREPLMRSGVLLALLLPVAAFIASKTGSLWVFPMALLCSPALAAAVALLTGEEVDGIISRISATGFGIIYVGGLFALQIPLRESASGANWLLLAYLVTWVADIGGYVVGFLLGRHKLCPRLSPGKTWEGALGGLAFALALSWGVGCQWMELFGAPAALIYGMAAAVVAPVGDLVESVFKRDAGVKDSSSLLPGHGGLLDRFDSFLFVLPLTFIFKLLAS